MNSYVLLHQNNQWSGAFHKVLDPNPDDATYTQRDFPSFFSTKNHFDQYAELDLSYTPT